MRNIFSLFDLHDKKKGTIFCQRDKRPETLIHQYLHQRKNFNFVKIAQFLIVNFNRIELN